MRRALLLLAFSACRVPEATLCLPCEGACGYGLECVQGVCVSASDRCGILELPPNACGGGPPCGDGFECWEDRCRHPVQVEAGAEHACARWPSGRVSCWGTNAFGQAGPGPIYQLQPRVIPGLDDAVDLSLGYAYSCALRAGGSAVCWGHNADGQLGNFDTELARDPFRSEATPQRVFIEEPIRMIETGDFTACAVGASNTLYCWGGGGAGCLLGDASSERSQLPLRVTADAGAPIDALAVGGAHVLVLAGGRVYGLGDDAAGQIANGGARTCTLHDLGLFDADAIGAGALHTCARDAADHRHLRCLGHNGVNQIHTGDLRFDEPVAELDLVAFHSCVRLESGRISCFGAREAVDHAGRALELQGDGLAPMEVEGTPGSRALTTGNAGFGCTIREGDGVFCWGFGLHGELGDGASAVFAPSRVLEGDFDAVAAGAHQTCAIERGGRVLCWGRNANGELASGRRTIAELPHVVPGVDAVAIDSGVSTTCALDRNAEVWCWGRWDRANLGLSGTPRHVEPLRIPGTTGAVELAVGWETACVRFANGDVACWGLNLNGIVEPAPSLVIFESARRVPRIAGATHVDAGDAHACALGAGGTVDCWGNTAAFGERPSTSGVVQLAVAAYFTCLLRDDGTVECWGLNESGQLGSGTTRAASAPIRVRGLEDVVALDAMFAHTCALDRSGDVHCWGQDYLQGRLGVGPTFDRTLPVKVPGLPPGRALSTGSGSACIVAEDGLWCWGWNIGQIDGRPNLSPTPVRVTNLR